MSNRVLKIAVSIILSVTVLCCSFSVYADDENAITEYVQNETLYAIWFVLQSFGINISYNDLEEFSDVTAEWLYTEISEFLETLPSIDTFAQWTRNWTFGFDPYDMFTGNNNMLEDISTFANYLRHDLGLVNNSSIQVVAPGYELNGGNRVYKLPVTLYTFNENQLKQITISSGTQDVYLLFFETENQSTWGYNAIAPASGANIVINTQEWRDGSLINNDNQNIYWDETNTQHTLQYHNMWSGSKPGLNPWGYSYDLNSFTRMRITWSNGDSARWKQFYDQFNNIVPFGDSLGIITSTIAIPESGVDYTTDDSIVIQDGQPNYLYIEWPESVSVDNLPAVISTQNVANPGIDTVFQPVKAFVNMAEDSMELMIQIIYRLPVEVNLCIFALMGSMILLGIIKIMREH